MAKQFVCSGDHTVVQTKQGKLRGYQFNGIYTFHGIKYADAKRFQMPTEIKPYEGIKDALAYGYVCPMLQQDEPNMEILVPHRYWPMDENCQYLNIWTPSLDENAKKPVMVWLHGGGFSSGSSIEHVAYEGDHLSDYGDVVVVSLNHRLNILGYLNLSAFGEKYANSGNAGNADMVMALKWIHDNIAAFGGDPENVTLFGQSGGGMKVFTLMNTPEADGLFHKGIIQSGVIEGFLSGPTDGTAIVKALLDDLGFAENEVEKLESVPYGQLAAAYNRVAPGLEQEGYYIGGNPIANDWYLGDPREVGFTEHAKTIPILIGSVFGEFDFGPAIIGKQNLSREAVMKMLEKKYGGHAEKLAEQYEKAYPGKDLVDLLSLDPFFRMGNRDFIRKKALWQQAPTYSYMFTLQFPLEDGKPAWHCSEIPFVFHNTDRVALWNIPGISDRLEERICGAWVHFARYGNPGVASLPEWPACEEGKEYTMILDTECEIRVNYDDELMETLAETKPKLPFERDPEEDEEAFFLH